MQGVPGLFYGRVESVMKTVGCLIITAAIVGCSGGAKGELQTYPVTGKVLYNDAPVGGATVSFWAPKAARAGTGTTDDKGEFTLSTAAGENHITVTKSVGGVKALPSNVALKNPAALAESNAVPETIKKVTKKDPQPPKPLVPEKYATLNSSPLKEPVTAKGPNKHVLKLTD